MKDFVIGLLVGGVIVGHFDRIYAQVIVWLGQIF
jgi:hypothetical protein